MEPMSPLTRDCSLLGELHEVLGSTGMVAEMLMDTRIGQNIRHTLLARFRQSVFSRLAGYEDANDAGQLCDDPAIW